jgi:hypothetical protein
MLGAEAPTGFGSMPPPPAGKLSESPASASLGLKQPTGFAGLGTTSRERTGVFRVMAMVLGWLGVALALLAWLVVVPVVEVLRGLVERVARVFGRRREQRP